MWGIIATWTMAKDGVTKAASKLAQAQTSKESILEAIMDVEANPLFKSVGYGGLPNEEGVVELDAGYMDGDTLSFGAVASLQGIKHPVLVAESLSHLTANNLLVGQGAQRYALAQGFPLESLETKNAQLLYQQKKAEQNQKLNPYDGHDTVGMVCLDQNNQMVAATSTSGLFMKKSGRVGDSPLVGSGYYADSSVGGACATGLGEDMMKGSVSILVVQQMEAGLSPQAACEKVVFALEKKLIERRQQAGDISVIAMNTQGEWGAASTIDNFSFVVATKTQPVGVYRVIRKGESVQIVEAQAQWIAAHLTD